MNIYELGYFESREWATTALEAVASEHRPIILPENKALKDAARQLTGIAMETGGRIPVAAVLKIYQQLALSHSNTDIFCAWKANDGSICGESVRIEVNAAGAYYQCEKETTHRTPKT